MNKLYLIALIALFFVITTSAQSQSIISIDNIAMDKDSIMSTHIKINVNDKAGLGATTLSMTFDPNIIQILDVSNTDFDSLTYNIDNEAGLVNIVTFQTNSKGVGPGLVKYADVELKAIGTKGSGSPLSLNVATLKNNDGEAVSYTINNGQVSINGDYIGDPGEEDFHTNLQTKAGAEVTVAATTNPTVNQVSGDGITEVDKQIDVVNDTIETNGIDKTPFKTEKPARVNSTPAFSFLLSVLSILLLSIELNQKNKGEL